MSTDDDGGINADVSVPSSSSVFELLVIFFSLCGSFSLISYMLYRSLNNNQERFVKSYRLDLQNYTNIKNGIDVVWSSLAWFSVSISFTIFNKWIMQLWEGGFDFPILMTALHMLLKVIISRIYIWTSGTRVPPLDWTRTLRIVIPIGVLTGADIMLSNLSIPLIPLSLYTALKTTVPVWSFVLSIIYKLEPFTWATFLSISALVCGLAVAVEFRADGSMLGVALVLCASLSGGLRWVLTQVLVETDASSKNVMVAIYRFSPSSFIFLVPIACIFELKPLLESKFINERTDLGLEALGFASAGGFISIALIGFEIYILRATTAVTLGIIGQFKEILQILLSIAIYREHISVQTGVGLSVSVIAANFYRLIKQGYFGNISSSNNSNNNNNSRSSGGMAMRKDSSRVEEDGSYNPLRGYGDGEIDGADEELTAGLDVFLEVDSDGEGNYDDDLYVL
jgi:solute carrier family 35, member C2